MRSSHVLAMDRAGTSNGTLEMLISFIAPHNIFWWSERTRLLTVVTEPLSRERERERESGVQHQNFDRRGRLPTGHLSSYYTRPDAFQLLPRSIMTEGRAVE